MYSRYLKVEGNDFNRGREIGAILKNRIEANYVNLVRHYGNLGYNFEKWVEQCDKYIPIMEKYAPHTLAEVQGMAAGACLPVNKVLAITTAYEKSFDCDKISVSDKCTAFTAMGAATKSGLTICGQTNDERMDEFAPELDLTIHHKSEDGHEMMIYTHPGITAYMGCNNKGVAVLWTYIDNGLRDHGVPTNVIIREVLQMDYEQAVEYIQTIPHAIPNYFMICHKDKGSTGLECFPNKVYTEVYEVTGTHSNHNIFAHGEPDTTVSWSTQQRNRRMATLLQENFGKIDANIAKEFFKDHANFPYSICTHPNHVRPMAKTLAGQVYDLSEGKMYITHSNPCEYPYLCHEFDEYKA